MYTVARPTPCFHRAGRTPSRQSVEHGEIDPSSTYPKVSGRDHSPDPTRSRRASPPESSKGSSSFGSTMPSAATANTSCRSTTRSRQPVALPDSARTTGITRLQEVGLDYGPPSPLHFVVAGDHHRAMPGIFLHRTMSYVWRASTERCVSHLGRPEIVAPSPPAGQSASDAPGRGALTTFGGAKTWLTHRRAGKKPGKELSDRASSRCGGPC